MVLFWLYLTLLFTFFYPQNSYFSETTYCRHLKPNLSHFFGQICNCGSFSAALVWNDLKKLENSKNLPMYPPPEMKIFEISPKMRCFGGKRWEKLWIRWNWPFRVNLSLILGEKIEKYAKMAILTQSKPLFWPNLPLWVIFSSIGVKLFEKVGKLKKFADVPPPPQKWKFLRFLQKWDALVEKDGKSCESGEIDHSESISASFWGKR